MMNDSSSNQGETVKKSGRKRKIPPTSATSLGRGAFPRKRAATACNVCRARKTRCDNERPVCNSCRELQANCVYPDQTSDNASYDPASINILERLNYLIGLIESAGLPVNYAHQELNGTGDGSSSTDNVDVLDPEQNFASAEAQISTNNVIHNATLEEHNSAPWQTAFDNNSNDTNSVPVMFYGSSEDILGWPIFQAKNSRLQIEELIIDPSSPEETNGHTESLSMLRPKRHSSSQGGKRCDPRCESDVKRGLREEDVVTLVEKFLANVHIKNPIFDCDILRGVTKTVAGTGFQWDASSCLVLLACACAALSQPFLHTRITECGNDDSLQDTSDYATAEAYYDAARKRIGLLTNTHLAIECHFLAGVYEMYSLRPLRASISFNRACVAFQALTWMKSEPYLDPRRLEKAQASRLYWSCLKSEHEIMVELRFPASGLTTLNYTQSFPSPPLAASTFQAQEACSPDIQTSTSVASSTMELQQEKSWYYYLADIAVRRILQRVVDSFYKLPNDSWTNQSIRRMIRTADELDQQLTQWRINLPEHVTFDETSPSDEELSFHLQARDVEVQERIYRPFLFLAIHHSTTQIPPQPKSTTDTASTTTTTAATTTQQYPTLKSLLDPLVQRHLSACIRLIHHWNTIHRHHGTWLMARQSFASGLLLVAAHRAGFDITSGDELVEVIQICLVTLRYWEREAPDLRVSRLILADLAAGILDRGRSTMTWK